MGPEYQKVYDSAWDQNTEGLLTVRWTRIQLFMTIQRMGPEYRMFIDSEWDQNTEGLLTVQRTRI